MSSGPGPTSPAQPPKDFFVSYTGRDRTWAEWIAFTLEEAGYTTVIQAWDSRPGMNFVAMMNNSTNQTERTIAVLSEAYLESEFGFAEWATAFRRDPTGSQRRLVPVRIEACEIQGLLGPIVYVDLIGLDETQAKERLLAGVKQGRAKPLTAGFPGSASSPKSGALVLERPLFPPSLPPLWNIPYPRNPFFLGRESELAQVRQQLQASQTTTLSQPQAICGLGGIGKTQIAVEYAWQHRQDYSYVLWCRADTYEALGSGYVALAKRLDLPEKDDKDQNIIVKAVKLWLTTHPRWLLILDNADDLSLLKGFLPSERQGHLLITTRAQAMGTLAHPVEVEVMPPDVGATLLLRRARLITLEASLDVALPVDVAIARTISEKLGGLPLALDQAGAYIEETGCGLGGYQDRSRSHQALLLKRRGSFTYEYPASVATTWSLSFEQVEQQNPGAAELLRCCAFLHPDAIPEELFTESVTNLGRKLQQVGHDALAFDEAMRLLLSYSLIRRNPGAGMLSVHRLVQAVIMDTLSTRTKKRWQAQVVQMINAIFPERVVDNLESCDRLLPHTLVCVPWIEREAKPTQAAARLLGQAGDYLRERGLYLEAEPLLVLSRSISEQQLGLFHPDTARSLNILARLYWQLGRYAEAEPLYQQALSIQEQQLGPLHPDTAHSLNNLAVLYWQLGRYAEAEPLYQQALSIQEQQLGPLHPDTARSLNNLALLYDIQGKYEQAEPLYQRAVYIHELQLGPLHPSTTRSLHNLANLYREQGKYEQAEQLFQRTLAIKEQQLGPLHLSTAKTLHGLAILYREQGKYEQAELLFERTLDIQKKALISTHPDFAETLHDFAILRQVQSRYGEARSLYKHALIVRTHTFGSEHSETTDTRERLRAVLIALGRTQEEARLEVAQLEPEETEPVQEAQEKSEPN